MNFEQEIHNQNNARRMNILKGFSDFSEDLLQKSEDGSELEKSHMDFSNQRVYADNSVNRKLNRVGQKYGGRNVEDEKGVDKKDNSEEEGDENKPTPPQETQPNEQGKYSTEQLTEFASQAEDWQLQEFLDNAKKSGDNSEYMQAQINIAQDELNRRMRPGGEDSQEEIGKQYEEDENGIIDVTDDEAAYDAEHSGEIDYSNSDSVRNFLATNPDAKQAVVDMIMEDIFLSPAQALRLHQAQTQSGNEALQTVEEAKNMLDELHAKLGGNESQDDDEENKIESGNSFFEKYYEIAESDADWEPYLQEIENYNSDNDLGLDDKNQETNFDKLPDEQKSILSKMINDSYKKFKTDTNRFDDNTNSENQSSNDKERTNEANKNSNQYGVDKVSQKSLQNIYDSGEHYEDAEDFRESVRDYNNEDSGVSDLSDKEIETWFDLYNSDKRKY